MKVIPIKSPEAISSDQKTILVLGYFDGLHKGHKVLFDEALVLAKKQNLPIVVLTFPESPQLAFRKFEPDLLCHLTAFDHRLALFEAYGVDQLYLTDFTSQFAKQTSQEFVTNYVSRFNPAAIVVGFDYRFGSDRSDSSVLTDLVDIPVVTISEVSYEGEKISSTRIRRLIKEGNIELANHLLGYDYRTKGIVVHGDARGRTIGFPTANLALTDRVYLPADGVYVTEVLVADKRYHAMTSVGKNVTFDGQETRIETHLLDFEGDIYGERIDIFWKAYIRPMERFDNVEALIEQLKKDREFAINWRKSIEI